MSLPRPVVSADFALQRAEIRDSRPEVLQTVYQIVAAPTKPLLDSHPDLRDSGKVHGDGCLDEPYAGGKLGSRQRVCWRVRTWDHRGEASGWSEIAGFESGLLKPNDWVGPTPFSPPSGPATGSFIGLHRESNFLAIEMFRL